MSGKGYATTGLVLGSIGTFMTAAPFILIPAVQKIRIASIRNHEKKQLAQIGLAIDCYRGARLDWLPFQTIRSPEGKPLLSWRVAILPYLDEERLYRQFHLDEPWDSPHNKQLLEYMPSIYLLPGQQNKDVTHFQVLVGANTAFPANRQQRLSRSSPGAANTILVVTARDPVPWTKPEDLAYDPDRSLPALDCRFAAGVQVLLGDGTVQTIPHDTSTQAWRNLIEIRPEQPEDS